MGIPVTWGSDRERVREVGRFRVLDLRFPPRLQLAPHVHERTTYALVLRGGFAGSQAEECGASTLQVEPAGAPHRNAFGPRGARVVIVQPDADAESLRPAVAALGRITQLRDPRLAQLGRAIAIELAGEDDLVPIALEGLALDVLATAGRLAAPTRDPTAPWVRTATDYVHAHFRESLRVETIARAVDIEGSRLARAFRIHHGVSIAGYVRRLRVEHAAMRLAGSSDPISAIAHESGFADQPHLTRALRASLGLTPRRYREIARH